MIENATGVRKNFQKPNLRFGGIENSLSGVLLSPQLNSILANDPTAKKQFETQWQNFLHFKRLKSTRQHLVTEINPGDIWHGLTFDRTKLSNIFKTGVLSSEIGYLSKPVTVEDGETFGCADFFVNRTNSHTVTEYARFCSSFKKTGSALKIKQPENSYFPNASNRGIALVFDAQSEGLCPFLENSCNGKEFLEGTTRGIERFVHHFPQNTDRHLAVLCGLPSEFIKFIVVGGKITKDEVDWIKRDAKDHGLSLNVVDLNGDIL